MECHDGVCKLTFDFQYESVCDGMEHLRAKGQGRLTR